MRRDWSGLPAGPASEQARVRSLAWPHRCGPDVAAAKPRPQKAVAEAGSALSALSKNASAGSILELLNSTMPRPSSASTQLGFRASTSIERGGELLKDAPARGGCIPRLQRTPKCFGLRARASSKAANASVRRRWWSRMLLRRNSASKFAGFELQKYVASCERLVKTADLLQRCSRTVECFAISWDKPRARPRSICKPRRAHPER